MPEANYSLGVLVLVVEVFPLRRSRLAYDPHAGVALREPPVHVRPSVSHEVDIAWTFDTLLGAMYLQMYWIMASSDSKTRCEHCGRIISLGRPHPDGRKRRRDKRFCDDACRQAHHRSKQMS